MLTANHSSDKTIGNVYCCDPAGNGTPGCDDVACFAQIGGALGVNELILGSISKLGSQIIVSLKLVNVADMTIDRSQSRTQDDENLYESAVYLGKPIAETKFALRHEGDSVTSMVS